MSSADPWQLQSQQWQPSKQEGHQFEVSIVYIVRPISKQKLNKIATATMADMCLVTEHVPCSPSSAPEKNKSEHCGKTPLSLSLFLTMCVSFSLSLPLSPSTLFSSPSLSSLGSLSALPRILEVGSRIFRKHCFQELCCAGEVPFSCSVPPGRPLMRS